MLRIFFTFAFLFFGTLSILAQKDEQADNVKLHHNLLKARNSQQKIKAILELGLYHYSLSNQFAYPRSADSAFYFAKKLASVSNAVNYKHGIGESHLLNSKIYINEGASDQAIQLAQQALAIFSELNEKNDIARSYMAIVSARGTEEDINESILLAEKAHALYKQSENPLEQANALVEIAYLKMGLGNMEAAKKNLEGVLLIYKKYHHNKTQRVYSLLGVVYSQMGNYKESLENSLHAIKQVENDQDKSVLAAEIYNYAAITYNHLQDIQRSNEYFQKAYRISSRYKEKELNTMILTNIIQTFINLNRDKEAVRYLKKLEKEIDNIDESSQTLLIARALKVYTEVSDFKAAENYYKKAVKKLKNKEPGNNLSVILYPSIIGYLVESAQYDKARNYVARYKAISERNKDKKKLQEIHLMLFKLDSIESKFLSAIKEYKIQQAYKDSLFSQEKTNKLQHCKLNLKQPKKTKSWRLKNIKTSC